MRHVTADCRLGLGAAGECAGQPSGNTLAGTRTFSGGYRLVQTWLPLQREACCVHPVSPGRWGWGEFFTPEKLRALRPWRDMPSPLSLTLRLAACPSSPPPPFRVSPCCPACPPSRNRPRSPPPTHPAAGASPPQASKQTASARPRLLAPDRHSAQPPGPPRRSKVHRYVHTRMPCCQSLRLLKIKHALLPEPETFSNLCVP